MMKKWIISIGFGTLAVLSIASALSTLCWASSQNTFTLHEPIVIAKQHYPADDPCVIEGLEIAGSENAGIFIENSSNIIIHDCFIRDSDDAGICVMDSHNIIIENCIVSKNTLTREGMLWGGIVILRSENILIKNNQINETTSGAGIAAEDNCLNIQIEGNVLTNNGSQRKQRDQQGYGIPGTYPDFGISSGISVGANSCNIVISGNQIENSTSDGISIKDRVKNIEVFNNVLSKNDEQGIWLVYIGEGVKIHHNQILDSVEFGIFLEWAVENVEIYTNDIERSMYNGVAISNSRNNKIYNNTIVQTRNAAIVFSYENKASTEYIRSLHPTGFRTAGNEIINNTIYAEKAFEQSENSMPGYNFKEENYIEGNKISESRTSMLIAGGIIIGITIGSIWLFKRKKTKK